MVDSVIRLFDENATEFVSNGIGYLPDATSCEVTEKRNDTFELSMRYPVTGKRYSDITLRRILVTKSNPYDKPQAFRIYDISKPFNGIVTFNAEHISYDLSGIPVNPFESNTIQEALTKLKNNAVLTGALPFTFWSDVSVNSLFKMDTPNSIKAVIGGISPSILDIYGGECEFDNFEVKIHQARGEDRGYSIRYGKNLTDLTQDESLSNIYTGVYPYWHKDDDGLVTANPRIVPVPGNVGFEKIYILDCSSDFVDPPSASQLKNMAEKYIKDNNLETPDISVSVSFVALSKTKEYETLKILDKVKLCDTVEVEFEKLGVKTKLKCVETVYNVLTDRYTSISLGVPKTTLAKTVVDNKNEAQSNLDKSNDNTDELIKKTSQRWSLELEEFNHYVDSEFTEVTEHFKNEISITARGLDAKITSEVKEVRTDLGTSVTKLENDIRITAEGFSADLSKTKDGLEKDYNGKIKYVNESLSASINATAEALTMNFNKEVTTVRNELVTSVNTLDGEIDRTEASVRREIITTKETLEGEISASAAGLRADFAKTYETKSDAKTTKEALEGEIAASAAGLTASFSATYETKEDAKKTREHFESEFKITATQINAKVSKGSVISEINLESGNATINADKINLNGTVTANDTFIIDTDGTAHMNSGATIGPFEVTDTALTGGSSNGYAAMGIAGERYAFSAGTSSGRHVYINHDGYMKTDRDIDALGYVAGSKIVARSFAGGGYNNENYVNIGWSAGGGYVDLYHHGGFMGDVRAFSNALELLSATDLSLIAQGGTIHLRNDVKYYGSLEKASSIRYKENVFDITEETANGVSMLRPVEFTYIDTKRKSYGFIAEEAIKHLPQIVSLDKEGRPDRIDYVKTIPFIVKKLQMLERMIKHGES